MLDTLVALQTCGTEETDLLGQALSLGSTSIHADAFLVETSASRFLITISNSGGVAGLKILRARGLRGKAERALGSLEPISPYT